MAVVLYAFVRKKRCPPKRSKHAEVPLGAVRNPFSKHYNPAKAEAGEEAYLSDHGGRYFSLDFENKFTYSLCSKCNSAMQRHFVKLNKNAQCMSTPTPENIAGSTKTSLHGEEPICDAAAQGISKPKKSPKKSQVGEGWRFRR